MELNLGKLVLYCLEIKNANKLVGNKQGEQLYGKMMDTFIEYQELMKWKEIRRYNAKETYEFNIEHEGAQLPEVGRYCLCKFPGEDGVYLEKATNTGFEDRYGKTLYRTGTKWTYVINPDEVDADNL